LSVSAPTSQQLSVVNVAASVAGHKLFSQISFSVNSGVVLALYGGNGVGKTTLLRVLAGLHRDYTGNFSYSPGVTVGFASGSVSMLYEDLSLYENVELVSNTSFTPRLLSPALCDRPIKHFSSGERALAAFERMWVMQPTVILLDEITAHLDQKKRTALFEAVKAHAKRGGAAIFVSHEELPAYIVSARFVLTAAGLSGIEPGGSLA